MGDRTPPQASGEANRVIGTGHFWQLTLDITAPQIPAVNQAWFDRELRRKTSGARLAWNRMRRSFIVVRDHGVHSNPTIYPGEFGRHNWPFGLGLLDVTTEMVRRVDAFQQEQTSLSYQRWRERDKAEASAEIDKVVADAMPDHRDRLQHAFRKVVAPRERSRIIVP